MRLTVLLASLSSPCFHAGIVLQEIMIGNELLCNAESRFARAGTSAGPKKPLFDE